MTPDRGTEKLDELLKETRRASRTATIWALLAIIVSAFPGIASEILRSAPPVVLALLVLPVGVAVAVFLYQWSSTGNGAWYERIEARERLRMLDLMSRQSFGFSGHHDAYVTTLRMDYQAALIEGRKELAEYLKEELDNEAGPRARKSRVPVTEP